MKVVRYAGLNYTKAWLYISAIATRIHWKMQKYRVERHCQRHKVFDEVFGSIRLHDAEPDIRFQVNDHENYAYTRNYYDNYVDELFFFGHKQVLFGTI